MAQPLNQDARIAQYAELPDYAAPAATVLTRHASSTEGLTEEEAAARLLRVGPNRLTTVAPASAWTVLASQFKSVVVLLLAAAGGVAFLSGDRLEAAAIAAVLFLNAGLGFIVELRARRAMDALLAHQVSEAAVLREGEVRRIDATGVVPGDVIEVMEGERVPADARLFKAAGVRSIEAPLTGESAPVDKLVDPAPDEGTPLPERTSMIYAGTAVAVGRARAVVTATGMETEIGRIGRMVEGVEDEATPLERRLDLLGRRLVWFTLGIAALAVGAGGLRGVPWGRMVETGIALAVAAVPEGLPAVATIALAIGLRRMARRKALVRELNAVEALGSTTVVCTDKTGTLTAGEMTVLRVVTPAGELEVTGRGYREEGGFTRDGEPAGPDSLPGMDRLLRVAALTPRARLAPDGPQGDPTDAALLVLARKGGLDRESLGLPPVGEIPFSSETRLSVSFHKEAHGHRAYLKGAPEAVLGRSGTVMGADGPESLTPEIREALLRRNRELAEEGLRVIALAEAESAPAREVPEELTFLGLVGMIDPPAPGVAETIGRLQRAGIRTLVLTGDQGATALAVARSVGLSAEPDQVVGSREVAALDDAELIRTVARATLFSRVSPEEKLRIVDALRDSGEIVAMLGDGVNDAAALKRADVGVAMGIRGSDVAKETADIVLEDDRFTTVGAAVEEGRVIFDNIRKFVFYLFGCNVAEILVVTSASVVGLPLPLLPLQILWLNLVTDTFPALALAVEPAEPDVMSRPPRDPRAGILSRAFVTSLSFFALLITAATLGVYLWGLATGPLDRAVTLAFMTLALAQLFHLGNARSRSRVVRPERAFANKWALASLVVVAVLQLLAIYWPPLARVLGTVPLNLSEWGVVLGAASVPALVGQAIRGNPPTQPESRGPASSSGRRDPEPRQAGAGVAGP
jgi:Ca2+-transporting ATPase